MNERQKRFADEYIKTGVAETAALNAGYSPTYARGRSHELLANVGVKKYIEEQNKRLESEKIADMKEVKQFWTNTMRNEENDLKERLKASEYIAKTNAAFIDKLEHSGGLNNTVSNLSPEDRKKRIAELKAKLK